MTNDVHNYIDFNMSSLKVLMDYLNYLKECIDTVEFEPIYGVEVEDANRLKLSMLSFLLSGNFDNIVKYSSPEIKDDLINNIEYYRRNTGILKEDGKPLKVGAGLRIIKKPARLSDSDKIIKTIRDSIAHSKYTLINDEIHIINRDFEALVTVSWLESVVLTLFSNPSDNSNKKGASDYLMSFIFADNIKIKNENDLKSVINSLRKIRFTFNQDADVRTTTMGVIQYINQNVIATLESQINYIYSLKLTEKEREQELLALLKKTLELVKKTTGNVYDYSIEKIDPTFIKEFRDYGKLLYGGENTNSISQVIVDKYAAFNDKEKRNIIAYKKLQEIIQLLSQKQVGLDNFFEEDHRLLYYLDMCYEIAFKSYMNLAFNYTKEQSKIPYDFINSKIKFILPNYVDVRKKQILEKRALLLKSSGQQTIELNDKINKILTEINDYKNKTLDFNKIYAEKMRNAITHNNIKFTKTSNGYTCTFEDYDDGILNFKATGTVEDFLILARNYHLQVNYTKQKTIVK